MIVRVTGRLDRRRATSGLGNADVSTAGRLLREHFYELYASSLESLGEDMPRQGSPTKRHLPVLILDDKKRPSAFIFGPGDALKFLKEGMEIGDKVADTFVGETPLLVYIQDSRAENNKHVIDLTFENLSQNGIYIESISVQTPKPDKRDPNKGILDATVSSKPIDKITFDNEPEPPRPCLPLKVPSRNRQDVRITCDLLDKKHFEEKPYLIAKIKLSQLHEKAEDDAEIVFRIRWS